MKKKKKKLCKRLQKKLSWSVTKRPEEVKHRAQVKQISFDFNWLQVIVKLNWWHKKKSKFLIEKIDQKWNMNERLGRKEGGVVEREEKEEGEAKISIMMSN